MNITVKWSQRGRGSRLPARPGGTPGSPKDRL